MINYALSGHRQSIRGYKEVADSRSLLENPRKYWSVDQYRDCVGMMHETWMQEALELAAKAKDLAEVPVGAVVVLNDEIVGRGYNRPVSAHDPTAHAEIEALRDAAQSVGNYRLPGAILVVTVEPCTMCAGALVHARVSELVFGTREPRAGAVRSSAAVLDNPTLNHQVQVTEGVLRAQCAELMSDFFRARRT